MSRSHLHFLGVAGHAMRGVAVAARELGHVVTGTDPGATPPGTTWLDEQGIKWWNEPDPTHLEGVDKVIISGHTPEDDVEVQEALRQGIPVESFAEFVGDLTQGATTIVVAGSHGKTTTTSLLTWIFDSAGRQPDYVIGIKPHNFPSSVRLTGSATAILEGDEYRASQLTDASKFAYYHPNVLLITNVEMDHPDFFRNITEISGRYAELITSVPASGKLYYWGEQDRLRRLSRGAIIPKASYGFNGTDWQALHVSYTRDGLRFILTNEHQSYGELTVPLYGRHNVLNTVAAAAVSLGEGISILQLQTALTSFRGASRRFEVVSGVGAPIRVIDDYAHHPSEVATTIEAAKLHFPGRVLAVFRPHTYSRTKKLLKEYTTCFADADRSFIAPIEPAREARLEGTVSGADIAEGAGQDVDYYEDREELLAAVVAEAQPGDTILSMTVNGYGQLAQELATRTGA